MRPGRTGVAPSVSVEPDPHRPGGVSVGLPKRPALTGHIGKGQQFDWIVVVGAEEGSNTDFRAKDVAEEA